MALFRAICYDLITENSGEIYEQRSTITRSLSPFITSIIAFTGSSSNAPHSLFFKINIPENYINTASLKIIWSADANSTSGVGWACSYRAHGGSESFNQSSQQQTTTTVVRAPNSTAGTRFITSLSLTDGNFAAEDTVFGELFRDKAHAQDKFSGDALLEDFYFEYSN